MKRSLHILFAVIALSSVLTAAVQVSGLSAPNIEGKWYRVVPDHNIVLDFSSNGKCKITHEIYNAEGLEKVEVLDANWHFDGWVIVVESKDKFKADHLLSTPLRLSMMELSSGKQVLGLRLLDNKLPNMLDVDVFTRDSELPKPPEKPDVPSKR